MPRQTTYAALTVVYPDNLKNSRKATKSSTFSIYLKVRIVQRDMEEWALNH